MGIIAGGHLSKQMPQMQTCTIWVLLVPGLWCQKTRPLHFTLVVDNFGIKIINKDDVNHLISSIEK
jgi:hypothetical protein